VQLKYPDKPTVYNYNMNINDKIDYWMEIAIDDLDSAKIMFKNKKYLQSGFYCHQAIEKTLKGYYWSIKKKEPPYTHNLVKLATECNLYKILTDDFKKHMDILMPLNIEARYPDDKNEILKTLHLAKSKEILDRTEGLFKWIKLQIKK
jgi:HEPN domain-containing protein